MTTLPSKEPTKATKPVRCHGVIDISYDNEPLRCSQHVIGLDRGGVVGLWFCRKHCQQTWTGEAPLCADREPRIEMARAQQNANWKRLEDRGMPTSRPKFLKFMYMT